MSAAVPLDGDPAPDGPAGGRARTKKAPNAFRTISEVADDLHIPQHVLRFWETKFPQVRPLKRGGGRRYYRPDDIQLLKRIANLLYTQGYTIKGVQRLLREGGGRLDDDIPPAPASERDADPETLPLFTEGAEPDSPDSIAAAGTPEQADRPAADAPAVDTDLLRRILAELEEMRALLS